MCIRDCIDCIRYVLIGNVVCNKICPLPLKGCLPSKITTVKWVGPGKCILSCIQLYSRILFLL